MSKCPDYVWCLIPVFNHSATLKKVIEGTVLFCDNRVVVVDDGSTDANIAELLDGMDVTVLTHKNNLGKGKALRTGAEYVKTQGGNIL